MPPKSKGTPAKGTPAKSGAQSPARKGGPADPKQDAEEQKVLLKAEQLVFGNPSLSKALAGHGAVQPPSR